MNTNPYQSPKMPIAEPPKPVKVKAYGLIPLTRNAYLTIQVAFAVIFVVMTVVLRPVFAAPGHPFKFVDDYFVLVIGGILLGECVETAIMLAKYKKAYRERAQETAPV